MRNQKIKEAIAAVTQKQKALRSIYVQFLAVNSVAFVFAGVYALLIDPSFEVVGVLLVIALFIQAVLATFIADLLYKINGEELNKNARADYRRFYKNVFINAVIKSIDGKFNHEPTQGISRSEFLKAQIYRELEFRSEDLISGVYNNVKFQLSEAIGEKRKYATSTNIYVISFMAIKAMFDIYMDFKGTVFVCEFYKTFKGVTILADKKAMNTKMIGEKEILDNTEFNKEFRVFTDDKIEARYLLSPGFMQRLREVKQDFDSAVSLSAAFMDDKFYLFLNGAKDRFESSLFAPPPSLADAQTIKDEISQLLRIIDELNLSLDVYK